MARVSVRAPSIGGIRFDAVIKTDHSRKLTMTKHPVEKGADISDHAFIEHPELSMEVAMSDVSSGDGKSKSVFNALMSAQEATTPLTVTTRLKTYRNMMIREIASPDDFSTMFGMKATVMMEQMNIVETSTVSMSPRASSQPQKTGQTSAGTNQPQGASSTGGADSKQSILKQASNKLFGG